jgi:hypothetical protein
VTERRGKGLPERCEEAWMRDVQRIVIDAKGVPYAGRESGGRS